MSIFNGYMSQAEREIEIFENMNEIYNKKIGLMIEAVETQLETNFLEAECKVMTEGGSYDDLSYLYMEASNDAEGKKKGIIATIKAWVGRIWESIQNFFSKKFGKTDIDKLPKNSEADACYIKQYDTFKKIFDSLTAPFNKIKAGKVDEFTTADKVIGSAETLLGGLGLGVLLNKTINYAKPKVIEIYNFIMNKLKKSCDDATEGLKKIETAVNSIDAGVKLLGAGDTNDANDNAKKNKESIGSKIMSVINKVISFLSKLSKTLMNWWTKFINALKGNNNESSDDDTTPALPAGNENKGLPAGNTESETDEPKKPNEDETPNETSGANQQKNKRSKRNRRNKKKMTEESVFDLFDIDSELDMLFESFDDSYYEEDDGYDDIYDILEDF